MRQATIRPPHYDLTHDTHPKLTSCFCHFYFFTCTSSGPWSATALDKMAALKPGFVVQERWTGQLSAPANASTEKKMLAAARQIKAVLPDTQVGVICCHMHARVQHKVIPVLAHGEASCQMLTQVQKQTQVPPKYIN